MPSLDDWLTWIVRGLCGAAVGFLLGLGLWYWDVSGGLLMR